MSLTDALTRAVLTTHDPEAFLLLCNCSKIGFFVNVLLYGFHLPFISWYLLSGDK